MESIQKFIDGRIVSVLPLAFPPLTITPSRLFVPNIPDYLLLLLVSLSPSPQTCPTCARFGLEPQDFQGQRLADRLMQEGLVLAASIAFLLGYFTQNMQLCMLTFAASTLLVALVSHLDHWKGACTGSFGVRDVNLTGAGEDWTRRREDGGKRQAQSRPRGRGRQRNPVVLHYCKRYSHAGLFALDGMVRSGPSASSWCFPADEQARLAHGKRKAQTLRSGFSSPTTTRDPIH